MGERGDAGKQPCSRDDSRASKKRALLGSSPHRFVAGRSPHGEISRIYKHLHTRAVLQPFKDNRNILSQVRLPMRPNSRKQRSHPKPE